MSSSKKVLLIGWDAADWKVIHPLIDAGKMPTLESIVNNGVIGNMSTMYPQLSPMLWTTIATGKRPFKHGIYGFVEPDPNTNKIRPITNLFRKTKAIWNILSQNEKKSIIVGWWPSHPAEPINGVMVSNCYQKIIGSIEKPWPIKSETVHPKRIIKNLMRLRCHPQQLDAGYILPFVPKLSEIDQSKDRRIEILAKIIAENISILEAALAIMHHEPWDFSAIFFDGIDHFCHGFMKYHPPKMNSILEKDFEQYKNVVNAGYILHDIFLKRILQETSPETTVIIVSDHGFHSDHLRSSNFPDEPAGPAFQHRPHGIIVMKGPNIKNDETIYGSTLPDICPTILNIFELPYGLDMDGNILINAFKNIPIVNTIPSWDHITGNSGMHPNNKRIDPVESQEIIQKLVSLGYIEKNDNNLLQIVPKTLRELDYNLARSYMNANRYLEASILLDKLMKEWPDEYRFGIHLIECNLAINRIFQARNVLEMVLSQKEKNTSLALRKLDELKDKYQNTNTKIKKVEKNEINQIKRLDKKASFNFYAISYLIGSILFAEGDLKNSLAHFKHAESIDTSKPGLYLKLGEVYIKLKKWKDAERCFKKTLIIDPDSPHAFFGLCRCYLFQKKNKKAVEYALKAIGLLYFFPQAHFYLGVALHRLKSIKRAIEAFKVVISQNPNYKKAYYRLAFIYKWYFLDFEKSKMFRNLAQNANKRIKALKTDNLNERENYCSNRYQYDLEKIVSKENNSYFSFSGNINKSILEEETITVVTGLPRSGTSMIMQMLDAGGMSIFTDGKRKPDMNNPRGYFESEIVKKIYRDNSWLSNVKGKAVKIIVQFIQYLNPKFNYKIIFMERNMNEIIFSQSQMLKNLNRNNSTLSNGRLGQIFKVQLEQAKEFLLEKKITVLFLRYDYVIINPVYSATIINHLFLGKLDETTMANVVDRSLYRYQESSIITT